MKCAKCHQPIISVQPSMDNGWNSYVHTGNNGRKWDQGHEAQPLTPEEQGYLATNNSSFPVLHRLPSDLDIPKPKGGLTKCDWCGDYLGLGVVWECVSRLSHVLVCARCHNQAIVH